MTIKEALKILEGLGCTKVIIEFQGSGDDGTCKMESLSKGEEDITSTLPSDDTQINEAIECLEDTIANNIPFDWVNNEGGGGRVVVDPATGAFHSIGAYVNVSKTQSMVSTQYDEV